MKVESLSRKASGAVWLVLALLVVVQQYRLNLSLKNERAAGAMLIRYVMEVAELKRIGGHSK